MYVSFTEAVVPNVATCFLNSALPFLIPSWAVIWVSVTASRILINSPFSRAGLMYKIKAAVIIRTIRSERSFMISPLMRHVARLRVSGGAEQWRGYRYETLVCRHPLM